jgi:hypothetical protein
MTMSEQLALLEPTRPIPTDARRLRGLLLFESEALALLYLRRHTPVHRVGRCPTMFRARRVQGGWLLVGFNKGGHYAIGADGEPVKASREAVRRVGKAGG